MSAAPAQRLSAVKLALLARELRTQDRGANALRAEPIAIIGIGCRFPGGGDGPGDFWKALVAGTDAIREVPAARWDAAALFDSDPAAPGKITTRWGGFLDAVDGFDAAFFGISPREALHLDPQQRLFLEVAHEAIEDAGLLRERLAGARAGVFAASYHSDYAGMIYGARPLIGAHTVTGASHSVLANRLSYLLDLRGPSVSIDTACSSSLVALHLACQSLRQGESELALAGGVSLILTPELSIALSKWGFLAEDGRCKTFDARANGFVRGEGCGVVVLKRLGDALADGDRVLAMLRGTAVNQDGRTNVLTAPSGLAQQAVVSAALADAALEPDDLSYIEAHGTGTALGDPIELEALAAVIGARPPERAVLLGSVKTNIGHLEAAAGIAGVIKVVLAMQAQTIPPHLHFTRPNPHFDLARSPFRIPTTLQPWPAQAPRRAGVSSFGFGGTNAHVVLEEAPRVAEPAAAADVRPVLLPLSARSPGALQALAARYVALLEGPAAPALADVCAAAGRQRDALEYRLVVLASDPAEALATLRAAARGEPAARLVSGDVPAGARREVVFVFSGQGPQWWAMGRELQASEPVFAQALVDVDAAMRPHADWRLLDELGAAQPQSRLDQTAIAQPALFALQVALHALWRSWGLEPRAVVGHSVGEVAAAHVAGVFDLDTAARLAVLRGRIMQAATGLGQMAAIDLDATAATALAAVHGGALSLAAVNAPRSVVLSGDSQALEVTLATLARRGVGHKLLPVQYAFHSAQMEPLRAELERALQGLRPNAARVPLYSTVTGRRHDGQLMDAAYWGRNLRETVQFAPAVAALADDGLRVFVEIGPHPVLAPALDATLAGIDDSTVAASLRRDRPERESMLRAFATLHACGVNLAWDALQPGGRHVTLPTYPWQRTRYWVHPPARVDAVAGGDALERPLLGLRIDSPALEARVFEAVWSADAPLAFDAHRIGPTALAPATALLEAATAAAAAGASRSDADAVFDLALQAPLHLDAARRVQTVAAADGSFTIYSRRVEGEAGWTRHASGRLGRPQAALDDRSLLAADAIARSCPEAVDLGDAYASFAAHGLVFGPAFRGLTELRCGVGQAWAKIVAPESIEGDLHRFAIHPALLDACLQPCNLLWQRAAVASSGEAFLPVALDAFERHAAADTVLWSHVRLRDEPRAGTDTLTADVDIWNSGGVRVAVLRGLRLRRTRLAMLAGAGDAQLYREAWAAAPLDAPAAPRAGRWLLAGDDAGLADALGERLAETGAACHRVALADAAQVLGQATEGDERRFDAIVLFAAGEACARPLSFDDAQARMQHQAMAVLLALQALLRSGLPDTPVWLVTRGARCVAAGEPVDPVQAALWGLVRSAELEHPELACRRVDLDPIATATEVAQLIAELGTEGAPAERAWRLGQRLSAHVEPVRAARAAEPDGPWKLEPTGDGTLDALVRRPLERREPGAGEIEIEVRACALNFRDVLTALGMVQGAAGGIGGECVGVVSRVGAGVRDLSVGDAVMAFALGSLASHVCVRADHAVRRPAELSATEAAATPIAFLTAMYALERLAGLQAGESVLIHAATGGVGMAAVQVAQRLGAKVYATAGSPAKRHLLQAMGVRHVFDSRSLDFAAQIRACTAGAGVQVVLNALTGDFVGAGVAALAHGGRFLEMGKRAIWSHERMRSERPDVRYEVFDLGDAALADPALLPDLYHHLLARLAQGSLRPLPVTALPVTEAARALRTMAQAQHVGKLVLTFPPRRGTVEDPQSTWLVTGAFGALGLRVAQWLAGQGVRRLVLAGRRVPAGATAAALDALRAGGTDVVVATVDVGNAAALQTVLASAATPQAPLRGIVHAAGVLDDGVLLDLDWSRLREVMRPKVIGAVNLHRLTRTLDLDHFILFSAGAAWLGSPGQAGYCAVNLFLDALAQRRRAEGLPATSIAWGAWGEAGMAASLSQRDAARWRERGVQALSSDAALALLQAAMGGGDAAVAALRIDWNRFVAGHRAPERFAALADAGTAAARPVPKQAHARGGLLAALLAQPPSERRNAFMMHLRQQCRTTLELDEATPIDDRRPLKELGLDSLMAVELRNALSAALGKALPATLLFDYPTLALLGDHIAQRLLGLSDAAAPPEPSVRMQQTQALAGVSDAEAEAMLLAELNSAGVRS